MNTQQTIQSGSTIEAQIRSINLSQRERNTALRAASIAEVIVDAVAWVCGKSEHTGTNVFVKPHLN